MKYFVDCEYDWNAQDGKLVPISIGLVCADGREFYGIVSHPHYRDFSPFVREHVVTKQWAIFDRHIPAVEIPELGELVKAFIGDDTPEFWGDYAAFDYVVLSMLMGDFSDWPQGWPMHVNDLQQAGIRSGEAEIPHHALSDARAVRDAFQGVTA